jgi:hypothetical protein
VELITSDEMAAFIKDAITVRNKDFYIDSGAEFFELSDIRQEGSVLTVSVTNVSRTRTMTFTIGVA